MGFLVQTNLYTGERICVALFYNREGISGGRGGEGERKDGEEGKEEDTGGYTYEVPIFPH